MALLEVDDLTVRFYTENGVVTAVDGLSYQIDRGETVGIVGESGAGKSVATLATLGLIDSPGHIEGGEIRHDGTNLLELNETDLQSIRGNEIGMVFQDAGAALNPVYTVGEQIAEAIRHHLEYDSEAARDRAIWLLERVGIPDPATRYDAYPHELSAGMKQRVGITIALSCEPDLLLCDEPTSGLDVTTQANILELLDSLAAEFDTAVSLVSHDLGVVAEHCDRVVVIYAGRAVEKAPVDELFYDPKHPYTAGLLAAIPRLGADHDRLQTVPGTIPERPDDVTGCRFHPRCPYAEPVCASRRPPFVDLSNTRRGAACLEYTGDLTGGLDFEVVIDSKASDDRNNTRNSHHENA